MIRRWDVLLVRIYKFLSSFSFVNVLYFKGLTKVVVLPIHCTAVAEWKTVFSRAQYIHFAEISSSGMNRKQAQAEIDYPCCSCQLSMVQNSFKSKHILYRNTNFLCLFVFLSVPVESQTDCSTRRFLAICSTSSSGSSRYHVCFNCSANKMRWFNHTIHWWLQRCLRPCPHVSCYF